MSEPIKRPKRKNPILQDPRADTAAGPPQPGRARPRPRRGTGAAGAATLRRMRRDPVSAARGLRPMPVGRTGMDLDERPRRTRQRDDAASFAGTVLPRTHAVAARAGASRPRASAWSCISTNAAVRRPRPSRRGRARPRRPGRAGGKARRPRHFIGRRAEAARHDVGSAIPQGAGHRRQVAGRAGRRESGARSRRRSGLGRPLRALEEPAGLVCDRRSCRRRRWCRSTSPTPNRSTNSPPNSASRSTS